MGRVAAGGGLFRRLAQAATWGWMPSVRESGRVAAMS